MGLADFEHFAIEECSAGIKRKICFALSLFGVPQLIVIDEPTIWMDPNSRKTVWDLISRFCSEGQRAVLLSTSSMREAQALCTRIAIMIRGKVRWVF